MHAGTVKIFSDSDIHTVDAFFDRQVYRCIAKSVGDVEGSFFKKHTVQMMVLGVINPYGKEMPSFIFKSGRE